MSISGPGRQRIASPAGGLRRAAGSAFLAHTDRGDTTTWDAKTVVVTGLPRRFDHRWNPIRGSSQAGSCPWRTITMVTPSRSVADHDLGSSVLIACVVPSLESEVPDTRLAA